MNKFIKFAIVVLFAGLLYSCDDDSPALEVAEVQLNYEFEETGGTKFATVKSGQQFTVRSDQDWCYTEIYSGGNNNNLRITVDRNENAILRKATLTLESENASSIQIAIVQKPAQPFITVTPRELKVSDDNRVFTLEINTNTLFTYTLPEWIKAKEDNIPSIGKKTYVFEADALLLNEKERLGEIIVKATDENSSARPVSVAITLTEVLPLIDERFDWATSSSTDIYTSTNEVSIKSWTGEAAKWTSTTSGVYDVWTRKGYLKFCRGNTGADLVSPKLAGIVGTRDVVVTFKACGYLSPTGVKDKYHEFNISVIGGGTPSVTYFDITNYPDTQNKEHGAGWQWQEHPDAERTFIITGATAETQIIFLAGPALGSIDGNSRMGLDDIKVVYKAD